MSQPWYAAVSVISISLLAVPATLARQARPVVGLDLVEDTTAEMMESMKAGMSIDFMEAALLQATVPAADDEATGGDPVVFPSYSLTDVDGVLHTCTVRAEPEKAASSGKKSTKSKAKAKPDISTALDPLEGSCATLTQGYWSYQWCHRKDVTQFHTDESSSTVISLGRHTKTEVKRVNATPTRTDSAHHTDKDGGSYSSGSATDTASGKDADKKGYGRKEDGSGAKAAEKTSWMSRVLNSASGAHRSKKDDSSHGITDLSELAAIMDFYEGGDICEETGGSRSLKTAITCCAASQVADESYTTRPLAILVSIQARLRDSSWECGRREVSTCSYLVQVCSQLLCPDDENEVAHGKGVDAKPSSDVAVAGMGHTIGGVRGILQELEGCFPPKKESWWSYKLCFSKGISQYHEDMFWKADGSLVSKVTDEFSLGKWDKSTVTGEGEDLIRLPDKGAEGQGGTIVLEFSGGTECDLTGVLRSTTVHLKCGRAQEVREILEDRTCHYRILALSPLLCSHSALMPQKEAVRTVDCVAQS
ncbi:unnamed protein product [Scytosiphon promiscuus]